VVGVLECTVPSIRLRESDISGREQWPDASLTHPSAVVPLGVGLLCNLMIRIGGQSMLLNSTGVIAKSQHEEESALLRRSRGTEQEYCPFDR
jgi:hypothetical protein